MGAVLKSSGHRDIHQADARATGWPYSICMRHSYSYRPRGDAMNQHVIYTTWRKLHSPLSRPTSMFQRSAPARPHRT